jgi:DNA-binding transcriptional ArsR family regulator
MNADNLFNALASDCRREILRKLIDGPATLLELRESLSSRFPAVGFHLGKLRWVGLVSLRREGRRNVNSISLEFLEFAKAALDVADRLEDRNERP